jgi:hypothetical protein
MIEVGTAQVLARVCASDGEFCLAARHWTGGLRLGTPQSVCSVRIEAGKITADEVSRGSDGVISLSASPEIWSQLLSAKPPPFFTDIATLIGLGAMTLDADPVRYAQYYPAAMRAIELLRPCASANVPPQAAAHGVFDAPVGRYVHARRVFQLRTDKESICSHT